MLQFLKGSRGGSGQSVYSGAQPGGKGGGAIWIESRASMLMGTISAKGSNGIQYDSFEVGLPDLIGEAAEVDRVALFI